MARRNWLSMFLLLGCQQAHPSAPPPGLAAPPPATDSAVLGKAPARTQAGVTSDCSNYSKTTRGPYQFENNMWAQSKAKGPFEQCVVSRKIAGETQLGWTWNWPGHEPLGFGYPEIIFGWKPWSSRSTSPALPVRISNLRTLSVRYAVATEHSGKIALSISIFVTDSGEASAPNPLAIVDELVLWLDYPEDTLPSGTRRAEFELAGTRYELWHSPKHGDRGDGTGWDLYFLKGPNRKLQAEIQLKPLLDWLLTQNLVRPEQFIASVELGNELMSGSGTTWVQAFEVLVDPPG